jgi:hypothetical protein
MSILDFMKKGKNTETSSACNCKSFSEEFADEIVLDNYTKGVTFRTSGDNLRITYNGLLSRSGAQEVYAVVGYGSNDNWQDVKTYPMDNAGGNTFEFSVPAEENEQVNIVFKDNAGNWDNNTGKNNSFTAH